MTIKRWNNPNLPNVSGDDCDDDYSLCGLNRFIITRQSLRRYNNNNNPTITKRNVVVYLFVITIMSHYCLDVTNAFGSFLTTTAAATVTKNKVIPRSRSIQSWRQRRVVNIQQRLLPLTLSLPSQQQQHSNNDNDADIFEENRKLRVEIQLLKDENERLEKQHYQQQIVIETFEGEGLPTFDDTGHVIPKWYKTTTDEEERNDDYVQDDDNDYYYYCGDDDTSNDNSNACPVEPDVTFKDALRDRAYWLVGLLVLQSCSGLILSRNEMLLQKHPVIIYFLTMLVGAGGNAGNQASVRVIRGLALGRLDEPSQKNRFLNREFKMALSLSLVISIAGFCRASIFRTPLAETVAVTAALGLIVFSSICLGAVLPLLLKRLGVDPAHSSTSIQVVMDILGVVLTVLVSTLVLDSQWGVMLVAKLGGAAAGG